MHVYLLSHVRKLEDDAIEPKIIGIYSSLDVVNITIEKYKKIVGFKDYPDDFVVKKYEVIPQDGKELLTNDTVYFLQHEYSVDEGGIIYDYFTNIDIYAAYDDAEEEMNELIKDEVYPKSLDGLYAPYGFTIGKCILDEDGWTEGFLITTVHET